MDERGREPEVTALLRAARSGDASALERLLPLVYDELRRLARHQLRSETGPRTLQATALVHEAYMKLASGGAVRADDRSHFIAIAARAMRQVLIDEARRRKASKRGGEWARTTLSSGEEQTLQLDPDEMLALDKALAELDPRQRQVVEMRFFGGMEDSEVAAVLGVTDRTVRRDWVKARARLYRALYVRGGAGDAGGAGGELLSEDAE